MHRVSSFNHLLSSAADASDPNLGVLLFCKHMGEWKILLRALKVGDDWGFGHFFTTTEADEPLPTAAQRAITPLLQHAYGDASLDFRLISKESSSADAFKIMIAAVEHKSEAALTEAFTGGRPVWPRVPFLWVPLFRLLAAATDPTSSIFGTATKKSRSVSGSPNPTWIPRRLAAESAMVRISCEDRTVSIVPRLLALFELRHVINFYYSLLISGWPLPDSPLLDALQDVSHAEGSIARSSDALSPQLVSNSISEVESGELAQEVKSVQVEMEEENLQSTAKDAGPAIDVHADFSGGTMNYLKILNNAQQVLPGLYISNFRASCDLETLQKVHGITHVLCALKTQPPHPDSTLTYAVLPEDDLDSTNIMQYFAAARLFITAGRRAGGCLVHCMAGISRSATIVLSYVMTLLSSQERMKDAIAILKRARPVVSPNPGFLEQLTYYEQALKKAEMQPIDLAQASTSESLHPQ
eukprot:TRINITY_DN3446_c0_g1_i1.p1 TRINITY_DN3446_c0_g1~~TRINITY_DN3446_c0_g1_i1.p1  ORF type:complete len:470 (-),score=99.66 TRINITY_DN3446_c0_g1_i1:225-1634(-)